MNRICVRNTGHWFRFSSLLILAMIFIFDLSGPSAQAQGRFLNEQEIFQEIKGLRQQPGSVENDLRRLMYAYGLRQLILQRFANGGPRYGNDRAFLDGTRRDIDGIINRVASGLQNNRNNQSAGTDCRNLDMKYKNLLGEYQQLQGQNQAFQGHIRKSASTRRKDLADATSIQGNKINTLRFRNSELIAANGGLRGTLLNCQIENADLKSENTTLKEQGGSSGSFRQSR